MNKFKGDIDIDVANRDEILSKIKHVNAMMVNKLGAEMIHPVGIYIQDIPANPVTGRATFEYTVAEEIGYHKIDILNNSIYEEVKSMDHLKKLSNVATVNWSLLEHEAIVDSLPHIRGHFDVVKKVKPKNLDDLAIVLALIRPGKHHLMSENMDVVRQHIWSKPNDDSYYFKRSHSYSYALSLVVKLNLMEQWYADN